MKEKIANIVANTNVNRLSIILAIAGGLLSTASSFFSILSVNRTAIETSAKVSADTTKEILDAAMKEG